jgi:hypothetical protein
MPPEKIYRKNLAWPYVSGPQMRSAVKTPLAATSAYDLRPLSDDPADYDLGDDLLVDILAESAFVGLR